VSPAHPATIDLGAVALALAELGPERASTAALARAAKVAKPTLYAHFGSREQLVEACVEHEAERLLDHVYDADDVAAALATYVAESPGWRFLLLARHPAVLAARARVAERLAAGSRGPTGLAPRAAASAFLAAAGALLEAVPARDRRRALGALARALLPRRA
jgi:AcrR family transcriptional regulator